MLVGLYASLSGSYERFSELALDSASDELLNLADLLEKNERVFSNPLHIKDVDPYPYDGVLETLRVEVVEEDKLCIKRSGIVLGIRGTQEDLQILANNVRVPALESLEPELHEGSIARHTHIEWYPGHYYLSEDSDPLVVAANKP